MGRHWRKLGLPADGAGGSSGSVRRGRSAKVSAGKVPKIWRGSPKPRYPETLPNLRNIGITGTSKMNDNKTNISTRAERIDHRVISCYAATYLDVWIENTPREDKRKGIGSVITVMTDR